MAWLVTVKYDGKYQTLNIGGRRQRPPPFLVDEKTADLLPIEWMRWVSKHHPDAQPSMRSHAKRLARQRYRNMELGPDGEVI